MINLFTMAMPFSGIRAAQLKAERHTCIGSADAVLVLGARVLPDRPTLELRARLDHACQLWRSQPIGVIMVSGGGVGPQDEVRVMTRYLLSCGIPAPSILACEPGNNTWQSLQSLAQLQQRYGMQRFIVVSSGYHAARISWMAKQLKLTVCVSAPPSSPETTHLATLRRQQWREFIALLWIRIGVAIRVGSARAGDPPQAWAKAVTGRTAAITANPPGKG